MLGLAEELRSTEDKVSFSDHAYNDPVVGCNTQRDIFPDSVIAGTFHVTIAGLFAIGKPGQREATKVSFA